MSIIIEAPTGDEQVIRGIQNGVRFPDGSIIWANSTGLSDAYNQFIRWQDLNFTIDPGRDRAAGSGSWSYLQTRWRQWCETNRIPHEELVRVSRAVLVVIDEPLDVDA